MAEKRRGVITRKRIGITRTDHLSLEHYPGPDAGCDQLQGTHIGCDAVWLPQPGPKTSSTKLDDN